jgi:hypothetical protein
MIYLRDLRFHGIKAILIPSLDAAKAKPLVVLE